MTNITIEPCPVCGNPEMTVEHGVRFADSDQFVHLEDCPDCGKSSPLVCYDCQDCKQAGTQAAEEAATR